MRKQQIEQGMARIHLLIAGLAHPDQARRKSARLALEGIGTPAVEYLVQELSDTEEFVRKEAIRALGNIGDAQAVPALIRELEDDRSACRWLAAEALAGIGADALAPVLSLLAKGAGELEIRRGAHHVLQSLARYEFDLLQPVLNAYQSEIPEIDIPGKASAALTKLRSR